MPVQFQIDSGAECKVLPSDVYVDVTGDPNPNRLQPTKASVIMYNCTKEGVVDQCKVNVSRNGKQHSVASVQYIARRLYSYPES